MSAFIDETIGITVENFDPFWGLEKLLPARIIHLAIRIIMSAILTGLLIR